MLYLNALLGLGTALAPVLVAVFLGIGAVVGAAAPGGDPDRRAPGRAASGLPLQVATGAASDVVRFLVASPALPPAFWLFAGFALLYGIVETTSGNWATLYMTGSVGVLDGDRIARPDGVLGDGDGRAGSCSRRSRRAFRRRTRTGSCRSWRRWRSGWPRFCRPARRRLACWSSAWQGSGCSALLPLTISFGQRELAPSAPRCQACSSPPTRWATGSRRSASARSRTWPASACRDLRAGGGHRRRHGRRSRSSIVRRRDAART